MRHKKLILFLYFTIFLSVSSAFYEPFNDLTTITNNNGNYTGQIVFSEGVLGNAIDLTIDNNTSRTAKICFPLQNNFNLDRGTIEFWVKPPAANGHGFFDIGYLHMPNSWGIYKNVNYLIMEVKNNVNGYRQAWSVSPLDYDYRWHHVAAVWNKTEDTTGNWTYFKVCLDGECKTDYDGIIDNVDPTTLTTQFCIGWNVWYGYGNSYFDELEMYDYVKSDSEIYNDYLELVNNTEIEYSPKECVMGKPESVGQVKITCHGLFVNDELFTVKGVGYQPIPIGLTADIAGGANVIFNTPRIYNRDFPLLRQMNVNTIRTWAPVTNQSFLDAAYNNGVNPIYVVMGFWINCQEDYRDPAIRQKYKNNFSAYVTKFKDHPAVLVWALGNENNLGYCMGNEAYIPAYYSLCNELAQIAYQIEGSDYHPVGIVNGDKSHIGISVYNSTDEQTPYLDFWASNVYPGYSFGNWFDVYANVTGKPLLITEYGIDALNNTNKQEYESVQSEWVLNQFNEINNANMTIGSTLMEYSDEWWKAGGLNTHDYGGYSTDRHPDSYGNEEWWGIMRTLKNTSGGIDIMQKRQVYYDLQNAFAEFQDSDHDGIADILDNCPVNYNPYQEDIYPPQGNNIGDVCECEGNFDGDLDQDGTDAYWFKKDFGRSRLVNRCTNANPCLGDFDCDGDVDGTDAFNFKSDFGRSTIQNPCPEKQQPINATNRWCYY